MGAEILLREQPDGELTARWFEPVLKHGSTFSAPNIDTQVRFLSIDGIELPISVNETGWENSWVCSPYTHYVSYAKEETVKLGQPWLAPVLSTLLSALGGWLRRECFNRVVMVNNWLLSTNPWPRWRPDDPGGLLRGLSRIWPDHALIFRSLNVKESSPLLAALRSTGAQIVPSRQIWWYEPDSPLVAASHDFKRDAALLQKADFELVPNPDFGDSDLDSAAVLYRRLYIEKYSRHNPQFTADWMRHLRATSLLSFTGLREKDSGRLLGVEACGDLHGVLTSPIVGYDTALPRSLGLYRRLAAIPVLEGRRRGLPLNLSAGVGAFKALRGGEPVMEYLAVYDRHLPASRRRPWRLIRLVSERWLAPLVRRKQL